MLEINSRIGGLRVSAAFAALVTAAASLAGCGDAGATITRLTVGTPGPDPYRPTAGTDARKITPRKQPGGTRSGDTPGLYGGTRRAATCDPGRLVRFLRANPEKARAWAGALGIGPGDIARFVGRLTPALLRTDTLVTNHGFRGGAATGGPAVLQAGMGVLIDEYGTPAVKCNCGNPLTNPKQKISTGGARYTGSSWPGFTQRKITKIKPRAVRKGPISAFVLVDPGASIGFVRPSATTGGSDGPPTAPPPEEDRAGSGSPTPGDSGSGGPGTPGTGTPGTGTPGPDVSGRPAEPGEPTTGPGEPGDTEEPGIDPPDDGTPPGGGATRGPSLRPDGPGGWPGAPEARPGAQEPGPLTAP